MLGVITSSWQRRSKRFYSYSILLLIVTFDVCLSLPKRHTQFIKRTQLDNINDKHTRQISKRSLITFGNEDSDDDKLTRKEQKERIYTNGWAVQLHGENSEQRVKRIAEKYGFDKISKIGSLDGFYHLEHPHHPERSKRSAETRTELLKQDENIAWVEQQHEHVRKKRGGHHEHLVTRGIEARFADPLWDEQWYLDDKRTSMDLDVNVIPVWNAGISGKGVVVTILDDGIEHNHTDLRKNYDPAASWDVNDNDPDPMPRYDPTNENKHGTRCAGEVAAQANNTMCGVGVAYNSRIGGVRMLDGRVTDRVEAESLSLNPQYIDIYSASWGPSDDGQTVEGPGTLATAAFLNGITKGRGGLGSIYVWASGNGGRHDDSCNCDGYTASIYTLSISSSSDHGESPWYSEACASTLATTLSSGAHGEKRIVTTDLHNQCTERHTGTSASAPLAAGIIALALEKNPKLTWRGVQHVVAHTANWIPLKGDPDWRMNGIGLHVNEKFGFGLLDGERIVKAVDPNKFLPLPQKKECTGTMFDTAKLLRWDQPLSLQIESNGCSGTKNEIRYLEHVQLILSIDYTRRGDLTIYLTTPMGTRSCLLPVRGEDSSDEGFHKWTFMTTHAWGEDPRGDWILELKDGGESRRNTGYLKDWQLILHGTKTKPGHQNVTHPDVPLHKKAVPDDVKKVEKSSVQITQITYTFGNQGASQTYIPSPSENYLKTDTPTTLPVDTLPTSYSGLQNAQQTSTSTNTYNNNQMGYPQTYDYVSNNNNNLYNNAFARTIVPTSSYMDNSYRNLFTNQQVSTPVTDYRQNMMSTMMASQPSASIAAGSYRNEAATANLWDFFGRVSGKRSPYDDDVINVGNDNDANDVDPRVPMETKNSLTDLLQKLKMDEN